MRHFDHDCLKRGRGQRGSNILPDLISPPIKDAEGPPGQQINWSADKEKGRQPEMNPAPTAN